ncbi:MAG: hypothetical protein AAF386_00500, partial [Pseudomonadota bacterium]
MPFDDKLAQIAALKQDNPQNIALQVFDADYFAGLDAGDQDRLMTCMNSGIENPDSEMGCYACQPSDYDDFRPFFSKALARNHRVAEDAKHVNNWDLSSVDGLPDGGVLDMAALGLPALSMRVRVGRNLADFPLPGSMSQDQRVALETRMMAAFQVLIDHPDYGGAYHSLTPGNPNHITQDQYQELVNAHIMFKDMSNDSYLLAA